MDDTRELLAVDPEAVGEHRPFQNQRFRPTGRAVALGAPLVATALVCLVVGQRVSRSGESRSAVVDTEAERLFAVAGASVQPPVTNPAVPQTPKMAGCSSESVGTCNYRLRSVFASHKEFGSKKAGARVVQVLTNTEDAVSCGDDGLCWVWKIRTGMPEQAFPDHTGPVNTISVLHDATYILTAGDDGNGKGQAFMWDWRGGFQFKSYTCADAPFMSSAEFPIWRIFGLGCGDNFTTLHSWDTGNTVRLPFNSQTTQEVKDRIQGEIKAYKKTRLNGMERLAADLAGQDAKVVKDLILANEPELADTEQLDENVYDMKHKNTFGAVNAMAYVPTRLRFATGHEDGRVRYWSAQTGMLLMVMKGHKGKINAIAASPNRQDALSGGEDGTVRVWNLTTGEQKHLLQQPSGGPVFSLAVLPDGKRVAVGSNDGAVRIWDIDTGVQVCKIDCAEGAIRGIAVNPSNPAGQILAASDDGYVRVYDPK